MANCFLFRLDGRSRYANFFCNRVFKVRVFRCSIRPSIGLVSYPLKIRVVFAYCHRFATGEIFQDGVRFRRYVSERHFCFSRAEIFSHLDSDFIFNPETSAIPYWRHRHGLDTPLLPVLERIHALTGDTPQIVSVPAQPRRIMRAFMGLTLLLITVMLMRLFTHF